MLIFNITIRPIIKSINFPIKNNYIKNKNKNNNKYHLKLGLFNN